MLTLLIALGAGLGFIVAYHTYGRWLGNRIFRLSVDNICPSYRLRDDTDYIPTPKPVVFGHHFTSIAGTGPIVGPAIAVMWGWLPALLWVVFGSIFIGAVHDLGTLVVSLRNNGQTVGDIAGRVLNKRVRLLFLFVLFMALTIVLAIFGLVIANVFKLYPAAIFPCMVQIPIAVAIGFWLHRKSVNLTIPSLIALVVMYVTVIFGDNNTSLGIASIEWIEHGLQHFNATLAAWPVIVWVIVLLVYSYIASVLPVWILLQPRDYINSLQLISALGLIVVGLTVAAFAGGAPPVQGAERVPLTIVAPVVNWSPTDAPLIFPFLFITIACGAISGFHCLVSSGTSSKQLKSEPDARFVGYGSMLTEGFLATLVILACVAGLGLGIPLVEKTPGKGTFIDSGGEQRFVSAVTDSRSDGRTLHGWMIQPIGQLPSSLVLSSSSIQFVEEYDLYLLQTESNKKLEGILTGSPAWNTRYSSWAAAGGLARTVAAFVDGSANFLKAIGIPAGVAIALMGVLVASFAGTTLDTACRLQRYIIQELAATFASRVSPTACAACGYDLSFNVSGACPECGKSVEESRHSQQRVVAHGVTSALNPVFWLTNKHGATIFAVVLATIIAGMPSPPSTALSIEPTFWEALTVGVPTVSGDEISVIGSYQRPGGLGTAWLWIKQYSGRGGLILWPMFGATNQLLAGMAFLVVAFWLWRRRIPIWFLIPPMIFMLVMPAWAMIAQLFFGMGNEPGWLFAPRKNWVLIFIAVTTLALEAWMIVEAILLWPAVRGVIEPALPPLKSAKLAAKG